MNLHEYQGKEILGHYGLTVAGGTAVTTVKDAISAAKAMNGGPWVVKAQIHAGGRGKAGGVKFAKTIDEVEKHSNGAAKGRTVCEMRPSRSQNTLPSEKSASVFSRVL